MHRHLPAGVQDTNLAAADRHLHTLANQPPRHAVTVAIDRHGAIGLDPTHQLAHLTERWPAVERCQRLHLFALETPQRHLAGSAVHPLVSDLTHPPIEMPLQRRPADEVVPGNGVALDVADAALVLAFGPGSVGHAGARMKAPIMGKGQQPLVEPHLASGRVMIIHQRPRIVEQHLPRYPGKALERPLHAVEPRRLPLVPKGADKRTSRVAQGRHKQMQPHPLAADRRRGRAEVDLQLLTRRCFKPQAGSRLGLQRLAQRRRRALHRPQRHC